MAGKSSPETRDLQINSTELLHLCSAATCVIDTFVIHNIDILYII